jgi:hypothetical protein
MSDFILNVTQDKIQYGDVVHFLPVIWQHQSPAVEFLSRHRTGYVCLCWYITRDFTQ